MDTAQDKRFFCQKYDYAKLLAYIIPWDPANPSNHGSNYHAFADTNNKAGPKRVTDHNDLLPSSPSAVQIIQLMLKPVTSIQAMVLMKLVSTWIKIKLKQ